MPGQHETLLMPLKPSQDAVHRLQRVVQDALGAGHQHLCQAAWDPVLCSFSPLKAAVGQGKVRKGRRVLLSGTARVQEHMWSLPALWHCSCRRAARARVKRRLGQQPSAQRKSPVMLQGMSRTCLLWAQVIAYFFQCCGHVRRWHAQQQQVCVCDHFQQVRGCTQAGW